jgi:hypothetical protein
MLLGTIRVQIAWPAMLLLLCLAIVNADKMPCMGNTRSSMQR